MFPGEILMYYGNKMPSNGILGRKRIARQTFTVLTLGILGHAALST
jgi:hypothetical protein